MKQFSIYLPRILFFSSVFLFCALTGAFFYLFERDWADFSSFDCITYAEPSVLLDETGKELARFELDRRKPITHDKLPEVLIKAFVAAEDHNFFNHNGISIKGIIRSSLVNLYRRRVVQGASTITQQVARGMFLSSRQTFARKIKEAFLAFQLERHFTKRQILQLYLNNMYFGRGIYGVEAACRRFWNKSALDVTVGEAATLAAVAKSAFLYSPLNAPDNAKRRRNVNLASMRKLGFIDRATYDEEVQRDLEIEDYVPGDAIRLYIKEWIRRWAERKWGREALYRKGLKIQTTINIEKQVIAEKIFRKKVEELRRKVGESLNGGMLSIESHTGKIRVCIGGYNFRESQFNRAFQAVRQMGSSFKPLVYTAALLSGIEMDTVMVDEPIEMKIPGCKNAWKPKNWTRRFDGPMTLARAISYSNNIITIKTLLKTGIKKVVDLARDFGITRELREYPSIALGTAEASVKQSVAMFNVFVNNGVLVEPYMVESVKNKWGKKIWQGKTERKQVLESKINSKMVNLLSLKLKKTAKRMSKKNWIDSEVIGKTGSTNEAATVWYVGGTPELTTSIYLGRDDNKPLGRYVFGSQTAYPVWLDFYKKLSFDKKQFYVDPELSERPINWVSGCRTWDLLDKQTVVLLS